MKTIYLLRHAKSSWDNPGLDDYDRPLAPRGQKAAPRMGRFMAKEGLVPQRVLCSGALRARETWALVAPELGEKIPTEIRPEIYHATPDTLIGLIQELPEPETSVLLVGHNPSMEECALALAGSGEEQAMAELHAKFPTGALAVLEFPAKPWPEIAPASGYLRDFIRPKALKRRS